MPARDARGVDASALDSAARAKKSACPRTHHPVGKVSGVQDLIAVYRDLARAATTRCISA
jgi:hypothetical protein